jgi:hypothetical protein
MRFRRMAAALMVFASLGAFAGPAAADIIPSPANDLLLQANGGVASQDATTFGAPASRANDGNRDGDFFLDGSVSHNGGGGFLQVQMPAAHVIDLVDVWNRTDQGLEFRLTPFEVQIILGGVVQYTTGPMAYVQNLPFIPSSDGGSGASGMSIPIPNIVGDTVKVQKDDGDFLHLAELEAYQPAVAVPEPATCMLLAAGGVGLGVYTRFRRRKKQPEIG